LAGGMRQVTRRRAPAAAAFVLAIIAVGLFTAGQAFAQTSDEQALKSTLETRLAYVITGDAEVDRISKAGLQGLTLFLAQRTALEAGGGRRPGPAPPAARLSPPLSFAV